MKKSSSAVKNKSGVSSARRRVGQSVSSAAKFSKLEIKREEGIDDEFQDAESDPCSSYIAERNVGMMSSTTSMINIQSSCQDSELHSSTQTVVTSDTERVETAIQIDCDDVPLHDDATKVVLLSPRDQEICSNDPIDAPGTPKIKSLPTKTKISKFTEKSIEELLVQSMDDIDCSTGRDSPDYEYPPNHKLAPMRLLRTLPKPQQQTPCRNTGGYTDGILSTIEEDANVDDKENKADNHVCFVGKDLYKNTDLCRQIRKEDYNVTDITTRIEDAARNLTLTYDIDMKDEDITRDIMEPKKIITTTSSHDDDKCNQGLDVNVCKQVSLVAMPQSIAEESKELSYISELTKSLSKTANSFNETPADLPRVAIGEGTPQLNPSANNPSEKVFKNTRIVPTVSSDSSEKSQEESETVTSSVSGSLVEMPDLSGSGSYVLLSDFNDDTDEDGKEFESEVTDGCKELNNVTLASTLESYEMVLKTPEIKPTSETPEVKSSRKLPPVPPSTAPVLTVGEGVIEATSYQTSHNGDVDSTIWGDNLTVATPCQRKRLKPNKMLFEAVNGSKSEFTLPKSEIEKLEQDILNTMETVDNTADKQTSSLTEMLLEYVENEDLSIEDIDTICGNHPAVDKTKSEINATSLIKPGLISHPDSKSEVAASSKDPSSCSHGGHPKSSGVKTPTQLSPPKSKNIGLEDSPAKQSNLVLSRPKGPVPSSPQSSRSSDIEDSPSKKSGLATPLICSEGELEDDNLWNNASEAVFDDACQALLQIKR